MLALIDFPVLGSGSDEAIHRVPNCSSDTASRLRNGAWMIWGS